MASVALVLDLVPPSKVSHLPYKIFQWRWALQIENGLALSKMKHQACIFSKEKEVLLQFLVFPLPVIRHDGKGLAMKETGLYMLKFKDLLS